MIGDKIKLYREQAELTQSEFLKLLEHNGINIKQQTISKYERGIVKPPTDTLIVIARVLGKQVNDFIDDSSELFVVEMLDSLIKSGRIKDADNIPKNLLDMLVAALIEDIRSKTKE